MGTLGSLKPSVLAHLLAAYRGPTFLGSPINRPDPHTKSHTLPLPLPRPPGNDRDRVHGEWLSGRLPAGACPTPPSPWVGEGSSVWVLGDKVRPPNTRRSLDPMGLGKGREV